MLKLFTRYGLGIMLLIGAISMLFTHDSGMLFPIVLFPIGMIISGLGTFLHGPMDNLPSNFNKISISEKFGIVLIFIGMIFMLMSAAFKALF